MSVARTISYSFAALCCFVAAPLAAQTTLDFEYPPPGYSYPVIDGYGGFHWGATNDAGWFGRITTPPGPGWMDPGCAHNGGITCAFNDGPSGGEPVAFWRDTPFNFLSLLMKNYSGAPSVTIKGWMGATQIYSTTRALSGSLTLQTFGWANVDRVTFETGAASGRWFLADDLTYVSTPEPATVLLLVTGLAGLGGAGLLRRRKNARSSD